VLAREAGDGMPNGSGESGSPARLLQDPEARDACSRRRPRQSPGNLRKITRSLSRGHRRCLAREADAYDALDRALQHARQAGSLALEVSLAAMRAPDFIWGPGRVDEGVRYADEMIERLGHVPGVQQFALHLHAHMRARLGEFEGALEALSTYRDNLRELGKEREYAVTAAASGMSARGQATGSTAKDLREATSSWRRGAAILRVL
jgi:hypothetical protein